MLIDTVEHSVEAVISVTFEHVRDSHQLACVRMWVSVTRYGVAGMTAQP